MSFRAERIMALGLLLAALLGLREALRLPIAWTGSGPGAGFFPFWLAVGVTLLAGAIFLRGLRARRAGPPDGAEDRPFIPARAWRPLLIAFLPMMAVVAFINALGIYIGGALYLAGYMWFVGRLPWRRILLVSVLVPLALFLIFERWFLLPMPKGTILEYFLYER